MRWEPSQQNTVTGTQINGPVTGSQTFNTTVGPPSPPAEPASFDELRTAIEELRTQLADLRSALPDDSRGDADLAVERIAAETDKPEPDKKVITRWLEMLKGSVGALDTLASAVRVAESILHHIP